MGTSQLNDQVAIYEVVLYVRFRKYANSPETRMNYEIIGSMSSSFRRARALCWFKKSKLMCHILRPNASDSVFMISKDQHTGQQRYIRPEYNESQQSVISEASSIVECNEPKMYFLQGPPGTGKSHTIVGIVNAMFSVYILYILIWI